MPQTDFVHAIQRFSQNLSTLRDFVNFVSLAIEKNLEDKIRERHDDLLPFLLAMGKLDSSGIRMNEASVNEIARRLGPEVTIDTDEHSRHVRISFSKDSSRGRSFVESIQTCLRSLGHRPLLYTNALVSLVSATEVFIAQLIHMRFSRYPQAAQIEKENISFDDLRKFSCISDAEQYLIDKRVDEITRAGFEGWLEHFKKINKLNTTYIEKRREEMREIILRRNLVVHNDGYVTPYYVRNIREDLRADAEVGKQAGVTKDYLDSSIDIFESSFLVLASDYGEAWKKLILREDRL